jgi:glycosyltransferase involved in cell wall biosynthesis
MSSPRLSIIIPTYNRPERLSKCLSALAYQSVDADSWEVVVVNDGGIDVSDSRKEWEGRLNIVLLEQANKGPASARNLGAERARGHILAFMDDDCAAETDWVASILQNAKPGELIGGKVRNILNKNIYSETCQTLIDYLYERLDRTTDMFFTSNNMCIHAEDFQRIGGFDTGFRTSAGEDREFCVRARQSGISLRWEPEIRIGHAHELNLFSFLRLHFKYGRAAVTYRDSVRKLNIEERTNGGSGFYLGLLLHPFSKKLKKPLTQSMLLGVSQACTISGYLYERFLTRR